MPMSLTRVPVQGSEPPQPGAPRMICHIPPFRLVATSVPFQPNSRLRFALHGQSLWVTILQPTDNAVCEF